MKNNELCDGKDDCNDRKDETLPRCPKVQLWMSVCVFICLFGSHDRHKKDDCHTQLNINSLVDN